LIYVHTRQTPEAYRVVERTVLRTLQLMLAQNKPPKHIMRRARLSTRPADGMAGRQPRWQRR